MKKISTKWLVLAGRVCRDGSTCKELKLSSGKHVIRALFANGGHVPYSPAITSKVTVTVKQNFWNTFCH